MGEMPVGRLIINMSWPAILSMFIQAFYNVVDSYFVSLISEQALAAVTYIFPVQMLLIAVGVGTGVGINSLISRRLGARRFEEADMAASHGYRLSFFNWLFFSFIGIFITAPLLLFINSICFASCFNISISMLKSERGFLIAFISLLFASFGS